jgi:hypothetical protein
MRLLLHQRSVITSLGERDMSSLERVIEGDILVHHLERNKKMIDQGLLARRSAVPASSCRRQDRMSLRQA